MFNTTLKRSVATLGVVAGLLAAAGPASAQILDGPVLAKAGSQPMAGGYLASDPSSSLKDTLVSGYNVKAAAEGTQVGSEGVKYQPPGPWSRWTWEIDG